jgi:DNA-binding MarR family transcriptional regulator
MGCARARGMHGVTFEIKRAHLRGVAFGRKEVKAIEHMTPARFDVFQAIRLVDEPDTYGPGRRTARQRTITERLGLHPSTVSKMVSRMEELGWLERSQDEADGRMVAITITAAGLKAVEAAEAIVMGVEGAHTRFFRDFFPGLGEALPTEAETFELWDTVAEIADAFGDQSTLHYEFGYPAEYDSAGRRAFREELLDGVEAAEEAREVAAAEETITDLERRKAAADAWVETFTQMVANVPEGGDPEPARRALAEATAKAAKITEELDRAVRYEEERRGRWEERKRTVNAARAARRAEEEAARAWVERQEEEKARRATAPRWGAAGTVDWGDDWN